MPSPVTIRRGYLPEADLDRFLRASAHEVELLWWLLMADAGLRLGEVKKLNYKDLDERCVRVKGKGRKVRLVPITRRLVRTARAAQASYGFKGEDPICSLTSRTVERRFDNCLRRAGIRKEKLCPHSLRHTFATRLLCTGVDIHRVGVLLGHSSTMTTVGYLHTNEDALREAAERLDALNEKGNPPRGTAGEPGRGDSFAPPPMPNATPWPGYSEIGELVAAPEASDGSPPATGPAPRPSPLERVSHLLVQNPP